MGLDVSYDAWSGAYSCFMRFRIALAHAAGLPPLELMDGFFRGADKFDRNIKPDWYNDLPIMWDALRPDPIITLLNHSDCEDEIALADLPALRDRLCELKPLMPDDWHERIDQFVRGCDEAIEQGESLEFH
ncbi:MAG: hypothetical protein WC262_10980 [Bacteroidales bacterium]|jgi:hypothetical protein